MDILQWKGTTISATHVHTSSDSDNMYISSISTHLFSEVGGMSHMTGGMVDIDSEANFNLSFVLVLREI